MSTPVFAGLAGRIVASVPGDVVVHDLYDDVGSAVYAEMAAVDGHEVREFTRAVARTAGPVLDLAAGSGRLTLPLLALGRQVTALDLSAPMLTLLGERVAQLPPTLRERCHPVKGDMSDFALGQQFGAVVLAATSITLLDAVARQGLYRCVADHLAPDGAFLVSVSAAAEGDEPQDASYEVGTPSGGYRIIEHRPPGASHREVTVVPAELGGAVVHVCRSRVELLAYDAFVADVARSPLRVVDVEDIAVADERHRTRLVTLALR